MVAGLSTYESIHLRWLEILTCGFTKCHFSAKSQIVVFTNVSGYSRAAPRFQLTQARETRFWHLELLETNTLRNFSAGFQRKLQPLITVLSLALRCRLGNETPAHMSRPQAKNVSNLR